MQDYIKVSVILITYNHENFIGEAIKSILSQQCDFGYEIIVADDCSTDCTMEIIHKYKELHPGKFILLSDTHNLGITKNYQRAFLACNRPYIAVLEGDDYWTSPYKLQKHVDFLEEHKECVMSFNRFEVKFVEEKRSNLQPWPITGGYELLTVSDLVKDNFIGNFSTCVYRSSAIKSINPSLYDLAVYDWMLNIVVAQKGLIGYLSEVMSVYRLHSAGTWTQKTETEKMETIIQRIYEYDEYLDYRYSSEFASFRMRLEESIEQIKDGCLTSGGWKEKIKQYCPQIVLDIIKLLLPPNLIELLKKI